ncbi:DUF4376 domain-containing protein [Billgrantia pellis]|uniref:DUF4376 domain-containing protein n=1 Tax=Billgrantia pellis TaxID=2606936 RepID=A0A7V7FY22_9GAMM|nr:DUF4376 domain-containing protein [Halomonas pellis]KAA0011188.1 DUF4376 domain-containing protein [Halomonas pellis]
MLIWDINPVDQTVIDPAGRECPLDPMSRQPKVPGSAMTEAPPPIGEHEAARAIGSAWEVVADWRGHVYWTVDGQRHEITELGLEPPADALDEEPPELLERLAARKRSEIDQARDAAFAAGLNYTIAGEPDVIQTRPQDQINLLGLSAKAQRLIAAGQPDAVFTFRGLSNINRELTAVEMDELALAALAHIECIYQRSWDRKDAIDAILADEQLDDDAKRAAIEAVEW